MELCVQSNCKQAFESINRGNTIDGIGGNLVRLIHKELRSFKETIIKNILCEENYCADSLAKIDARNNLNLQLYHNCPIYVLQVYIDDLEGVSKQRILFV